MEWFESWFESPYYHVLYKSRNDSEAQEFLNNLLGNLQLKNEAHILDLACGKGRHAIYLNSLGYTVTGADLSGYNITQANKHASDTLHFVRQDMREVVQENQFDAVFNVFTSFGYFDDVDDNRKVLKAVYSELKPNGIFVLDFLNATHTKINLVAAEEKEIDGITFKLKRQVKNGFIVKDISIADGNQTYAFQERVQAFTKSELETLITDAGMQVDQCFGDYTLNPFDEEKSARIILVAHKPA